MQTGNLALQEGLGSGWTEAAQTVTGRLFAHADARHPAVATMMTLCERRRCELLAARDPVAAAEARALGHNRPASGGLRPLANYVVRPPEASIPKPPAAYLRLAQAVGRGADLSAVAAVIECYPALAARFVRLVRCAFPDAPCAVERAAQAVSVLEPRSAATLAAAVALILDGQDLPGGFPVPDDFFLHCAATGILSRIIGQAAGLPDAAGLFLAGALHDVGRIVLFKSMPLKAAAMLKRARASGEPLAEIEPEEAGYGHASAGGELLRGFGLSPAVRLAVAYHHIPDLLDDMHASAVVHLADIMAKTLLLGASGDPLVPGLREAAWDALRLKPVQLGIIAEKALAQCAPLQAPYPLDGGEEPELPFEFL